MENQITTVQREVMLQPWNICEGLSRSGVLINTCKMLLHPDRLEGLNVPVNREISGKKMGCGIIDEIESQGKAAVTLVEDINTNQFAYNSIHCALCKLAGCCANHNQLILRTK